MRVSFIDEVFYPAIGGGEAVCLEVGKRLVRKGFEIDVFTSRMIGRPAEEDVGGISIHRLPFSASKIDFLLRGPRLIGKHMKRNQVKVDIVNSTSPISRLVCDRLVKKEKFVGHVFGYWGDSWPEFVNPLSAFFKSRLENYSLTKPGFDLLVSSNSAFIEKARKLGLKQKIEVVPSGVDCSRFLTKKRDIKQEFDIEGKLVLFAGRVIDIKGLEYLVQALKGSEYTLGIVGDGPELPRIEKLASRIGVELMAFGKQDVPDFMSACDVFVLPSIMEGCPLTILEAFAAGKPVVASKVGGIPELITNRENGFLVEPKDVKGLRTAIDEVLESESFVKRADSLNREKAEKYSWDTITKQFQRIFEELA